MQCFAHVIDRVNATSASIVTNNYRLIHTCGVNDARKFRKLMPAMISSRMIHDPNIYDIAEQHRFKMARAIIQPELAPRNELN